MKRKTIYLVVVAVLIALSGCETLRSVLTVQRPEVKLSEVQLSGLTFRGVDLVADVEVHNPNPIGMTMAGFGYELAIEGSTFVAGDQTEGVIIESFGDSTVRFPVSLGFAEIADTVTAAGQKDDLSFTLSFEFRFELPILGLVAIPLRHEGTLPVPKLPAVEVSRLKMDRIGIAGADLALTVSVSNPNSFAVQVPTLEYVFAVQDRPWIEGATTDVGAVPAKGRGDITIPFRLSFTSFGRTVRDLLLGDTELRYSFMGVVVIDPDLALLGRQEVPVGFEGAIPLSR